jgi:Integrase zinc binding domain/Integrase core domain
LCRVWESADGNSTRTQIIVPHSRIADVLKQVHDGPSGGHLGARRTMDKVRRRFYWFRLRDDVEEWCASCGVCRSCKGPQTRSRGKMMQYHVGSPFERVAVDVMGPLPLTQQGNRYVLVVADYFSKWTEAYPLPSQDAATVTSTLVHEWICRFGVPRELHSDQGRNFEAEVFQEMCRALGIRKTRTTPLHPQSDGLVERFNRTLKEHLAKVVNDRQSDWDQHVQLFMLAYRSSVHESTQKAPVEVLFGREIRLPCDLLFGKAPDAPTTPGSYTSDLRHRLWYIHQEVRQSLKLASDRMKMRYDVNANDQSFTPGQKVWLYNPHRKKGLSPKLQRDWEGPYVVVKKINDLVYRIRKHPNGKCRVVHLQRLAKFHDRPAGLEDESGI